MAEIYVGTSAQIKEVIDNLRALNDKFRGKAADINQEHSTLTTKWQGDASTVFTERFQRQYPTFENFATTVDHYVQGLENILAEYEAAEEANKSIAQD